VKYSRPQYQLLTAVTPTSWVCGITITGFRTKENPRADHRGKCLSQAGVARVCQTISDTVSFQLTKQMNRKFHATGKFGPVQAITKCSGGHAQEPITSEERLVHCLRKRDLSDKRSSTSEYERGRVCRQLPSSGEPMWEMGIPYVGNGDPLCGKWGSPMWEFRRRTCACKRPGTDSAPP
jgi:hypothetical protein